MNDDNLNDATTRPNEGDHVTIADCNDVIEASQTLLRLEGDLVDALRRLPSINELNDLTDTMQSVIDLQGDFNDALGQLPRLDELNDLIEAMQTVTRLEDERGHG